MKKILKRFTPSEQELFRSLLRNHLHDEIHKQLDGVTVNTETWLRKFNLHPGQDMTVKLTTILPYKVIKQALNDALRIIQFKG